MSNLRSKEEVHANEEMLVALYHFYLTNKGFQTIMSEVPEVQVDETRKKYNLSEAISDFDLGYLEGKIQFSMTLRGFYDEYSDESRVAWIKALYQYIPIKSGALYSNAP